MSGTHLWLLGDGALAEHLAGSEAPTLGRHEGHVRHRGPYTAANTLLRGMVPAILAREPEQAQRHDIEILNAAPELSTVLENRRPTLTSEAARDSRTRFYPHDRVIWIGNGLTDLVLRHAGALGGGQSLMVTDVDRLDHTDNVWLAGLLRRADPSVLRLTLASPTAAVADPLGTELTRHAPVRTPATHAVPVGPGGPTATARNFVRGLCLSRDPAGRAAYDSLTPARRAVLHDAEADRLSASGGQSARFGAIPYHRECGSDPAAAVEALAEAQTYCLLRGFYPRVVDLGTRLRNRLSWQDDPEASWLATVKMTIAHQAMAQPDEAMALFDDACANSVAPSVHMQSAYGRAMVYTRYYEQARRDLNKAKGLVNTAVALASMSPVQDRRAYHRTFNENGLALIEMHLGNTGEAVRLIEGGIARLDAEVAGGRTLLHHSVLRYNYAQLMTRAASPERAIEEYTKVIEGDPNHPDYYFERAALLERVGRLEDAVADYGHAIRVAPPYPEPYYNRGDLRARLGDLPGACADFARTCELDPAFVDAYVNRGALLLELGDLAAAHRDVHAGLAQAPENAHLWCLRGLLRYEDGRLDDAREAFERALSLDDGLAGGWANLGAVLHDLGRADAARGCLERSLALHDDPDVRDNLRLLAA